MKNPTGPAGSDDPAKGPSVPEAAVPAAAQEQSLGGGPALEGWDSQLEEAVRESRCIGSLR